MQILLLGGYGDTLVDRLGRDHDVRVVEDRDERLVAELIADAELVVVRSPHRITDEMLASAPDLRWIIRAGSGTDNIAATHEERGVEVFTTPLNSWSVAELVFAMLLSLQRNLRSLHASLQDGEWKKYDASGREIAGRSLGVLGFGRIGRSVAEIAASFDMDVRAFDRTPEKPDKVRAAEEFDVSFADLRDVLSDSEVVAVCLPLTEETRGLLDAERIGWMRDDAILVNVGRGDVVDVDAAYEALTDGSLGGLGLDVYPDEPPDPHPLFDHDSVVCTPHVGAQTEDARRRIDRRIEQLVETLHEEVEQA